MLGYRGYKKLSDGTWEQPPQALERIQSRNKCNIAKAASAVILTVGLCYAGSEVSSFEPPPLTDEQISQNVQLDRKYVVPENRNQEDDILETGLAVAAFSLAAVVAIIGGGRVVRNLVKDSEDKQLIRRDVADNMIVGEAGDISPGLQLFNSQYFELKDGKVVPRLLEASMTQVAPR